MDSSCQRRHRADLEALHLVRRSPAHGLLQAGEVGTYSRSQVRRSDHPRASRLAPVPQRKGVHGGLELMRWMPPPPHQFSLGTGTRADRAVRHIGAGRSAVLASQRQWPGLHVPSLHRDGSQQRPETGVHHTALPAAERHDGTPGPLAE